MNVEMLLHALSFVCSLSKWSRYDDNESLLIKTWSNSFVTCPDLLSYRVVYWAKIFFPIKRNESMLMIVAGKMRNI